MCPTVPPSGRKLPCSPHPVPRTLESSCSSFRLLISAPYPGIGNSMLPIPVILMPRNLSISAPPVTAAPLPRPTVRKRLPCLWNTDSPPPPMLFRMLMQCISPSPSLPSASPNTTNGGMSTGRHWRLPMATPLSSTITPTTSALSLNPIGSISLT